LNRDGRFQLPSAPRRTVYGYIDRADLVEVLNTFDFASPDMPMGKRYETTVPQQALFLMNSPLVIEQVRNVVERKEFKDQNTDEARIRYLYELFFQRLPLQEEIRQGIDFVTTHHSAEKTVAEVSAIRPGAEVIGQVNKRPRPRQSGPPASPSPSRKPLSGWQEYAHALLLTNEASFVN
jgi:hypothetical protein